MKQHTFRVLFQNGHISNVVAYFWESALDMNPDVVLIYDLTACETVYRKPVRVDNVVSGGVCK